MIKKVKKENEEKKKYDIKDIFKKKERELINELEIFIEHPTTKGDTSENAWINLLRSFLPKRYSVDKGFVIDSEGSISEQIDIIIYDTTFTPLIYKISRDNVYVASESVYAIFEVKPKINKSNLNYANKKIKSVKELKRTSRDMVNSGQNIEARELTKIYGGILALKSNEEKSILNHLKDCKDIDLGLGCIENPQVFVKLNNKYIFHKENPVLSFYFILLDLLLELGTVPAIEIKEYAKLAIPELILDRGEK